MWYVTPAVQLHKVLQVTNLGQARDDTAHILSQHCKMSHTGKAMETYQREHDDGERLPGTYMHNIHFSNH